MLIGYILSIVCLKLNRFSNLSIMQYMGLYPGAVCILLTHFACNDGEDMCTSSYYHPQIGSMTHLRFFRFRSWNNGMRYMSVFVLAFFFYIVICRHNSNIEDLEVTFINLSKLELSHYIHVLRKSPIISTKFLKCYQWVIQTDVKLS